MGSDVIGNADEALFIRDWYIGQGPQRRYESNDTPEGWERLGSGCYRAAFLSPSGVVYKVQHSYEYSGQSNAGEAETLRRYWLTRMPKGCRLPRWSLYELDGKEVMAMERFARLLSSFSSFSAEGEEYWKRLTALTDVIDDQWDFHGANLGVDEEAGLLVPIDLGC
jgi:hypothetical protein